MQKKLIKLLFFLFCKFQNGRQNPIWPPKSTISPDIWYIHAYCA
jgi:hypothetical protein